MNCKGINMKKILIGVIAIVLLLVVSLSGCTETLNPPNVEITSQNARTGMEGLDYTVYVDVTVYNRGGDGRVTVWAEVSQGGSSWKKPQTIYLNSKESQDLTFRFSEFSFWSFEGGSYYVWVEH